MDRRLYTLEKERTTKQDILPSLISRDLQYSDWLLVGLIMLLQYN